VSTPPTRAFNFFFGVSANEIRVSCGPTAAASESSVAAARGGERGDRLRQKTAGSFAFARDCGHRARNGASVSTSRALGGNHRAVSRSDPAFGNVRMPESEM
jgi:hypothetical protein